MTKTRSHLALNVRNLALATIQVLQMWSDDRYHGFLCGRNNQLDAEWFEWFVGEWNVARTIQDGKLDEVRRYLDQVFRRVVLGDTDGAVIDATAAYIKASGGSAKSGKKKNPVLPISLVSKIGFFLRSSDFVPLDRFSLVGLNQIHCTTGTPKLHRPTYQQYLAAFNKQFDAVVPQIQASLNEPWVSALAERLGCTGGALNTNALRRKVLDNYLMHSGGYLKGQLNLSTI